MTDSDADLPLCYFCQEPIKPGEGDKHHLNFPKKQKSGFRYPKLKTHIKCQAAFHQFHLANCFNRLHPPCDVCPKEYRLQCIDGPEVVREFTSEDVARILEERRALAEVEPPVKRRQITRKERRLAISRNEKVLMPALALD